MKQVAAFVDAMALWKIKWLVGLVVDSRLAVCDVMMMIAATARSAEKGGKRRTRTTNPTTTTERVPNKEQINKQVDAKFSMPYRPFLASKQPSVRVH
jgi:hypothetical protein